MNKCGITSEFQVEDIVEEQGDIWLEDLDPNRLGLLVAVENNGNYQSELQKKINNLSEGEKIRATLKSQNEDHTIWKFTDIEIIDNQDRESLHA